VKALLVNGAEDIGAADIPSRNEGWGRINLTNVLAGAPFVAQDQTLVFGDPGQADTRLVKVLDPSRPLKVTIAWSDAPGAFLANPALVNDLDLMVERIDDGGAVIQRWLGNVFDEGHSVESGDPDRLNNLENVYVEAPAPGTYRITVSAENVPGDGVPGNDDPTDQDFALLVRNAAAA
jgi:hypothetical protein